MSAFGPRSLRAACRAIYLEAASANILPPLIRDAADPAPPRRVIEVEGVDFSLRFAIAWDDGAAGGPAGALERAPLRIDVEATAGPDDAPVGIDDAARHELARAYLLGVHEPLVVEPPAEGADWRIGLRIAPRFSLWSPGPVRLDPGLDMDEIAERLAASLLQSTRALFATDAAGRAVWTTRLREELFAEARLAAHDLWPVDTPLPASRPAPPARPAVAPRLPAVRRERACPAPRRRALAAALAALGLAALAGALASRHQHDHATQTPGVTHPGLPAEADGAAHAAADRATPVRLAGLDPEVAPKVAPKLGPKSDPFGTIDARFAVLAPAVTQASLGMIAPSNPVMPAILEGGAAQPAMPKPKRNAALLARPGKPTPLMRVDRAMRKFVKSVSQRLPRVRLSALASPHAAGPRRP